MFGFLAILGIVAMAGAIGLLALDPSGNAVPAILLLLISAAISAVLALRRGFNMARGIVRDATAFVTGDIQTARLVEVGDPKGLFSPTSNVVLELEGEDGAVHRFDRDVPVPFPAAWSYRIGQRLNIPFLAGSRLTDMMAFELRREGLDVDVSLGSKHPGTRQAQP